MKIKNYEEWRAAVHKERLKLEGASFYLNQDGKERLSAFTTLADVMDFFDDPNELLSEIQRCSCEGIKSPHVSQALNALKKIAEGQAWKRF